MEGEEGEISGREHTREGDTRGGESGGSSRARARGSAITLHACTQAHNTATRSCITGTRCARRPAPLPRRAAPAVRPSRQGAGGPASSAPRGPGAAHPAPPPPQPPRPRAAAARAAAARGSTGMGGGWPASSQPGQVAHLLLQQRSSPRLPPCRQRRHPLHPRTCASSPLFAITARNSPSAACSLSTPAPLCADVVSTAGCQERRRWRWKCRVERKAAAARAAAALVAPSACREVGGGWVGGGLGVRWRAAARREAVCSRPPTAVPVLPPRSSSALPAPYLSQQCRPAQSRPA